MSIRKLGIIFGLGIGIMTSASTAFALGPVNRLDQAPGAQRDLVDASFFGRPYPYGYTGWSPCFRYVEVDTRYGRKLRRVWICR